MSEPTDKRESVDYDLVRKGMAWSFNGPFPPPPGFDDYTSLPRRLVRLAHVAAGLRRVLANGAHELTQGALFAHEPRPAQGARLEGVEWNHSITRK